MVWEDQGDIGAKFSRKFSGAEEKDQGNTLLFEIVNAKAAGGEECRILRMSLRFRL